MSESRLIFDVGMHKGEDTDYYLKKGFRVVGFEADPALIGLCRERFSKEIASGSLVIVEGAIADQATCDRGDDLTFYTNSANTVWGTVHPDWVARNSQRGAASNAIHVRPVDFADALRRFGTPYYLKIDIEGSDGICLTALKQSSPKPRYLSIESNKVSFSELEAEISLLSDLGYTRFKAVQQSAVQDQREPRHSSEGENIGYRFLHGSSGLFGSDLPGQWKDAVHIIREYRRIFREYKLFGDHGSLRKHLPGKVLRRGLEVLLRRPVPGWYDTHCSRASIE